MNPRTVLLVDDKRNMLAVMRMALEEAGHRVLSTEYSEEALELLRNPDIDVLVCDLKMPGITGQELITRSRQIRPDIPVVVVTAYGSIRSAIDCIQAGASDYLTKPFEPEELQIVVQRAIQLHDLVQENRQLQAAVSGARRLCRLVGEGPTMQHLIDQIEQVAPYRTNVLISGESGTGKEAVARTIHERGSRAERPWVAINCSAIPRDLMESELFGYVKGAYTGAAQGRLGRLEQAHSGTLFLDEVGDLELPLQAKLLRVIQEREFSPVGSNIVRRVDVRFIAATNRDLRTLVQEGRFREDLFYRLDVYNIRVPPLRERPEDIQALAETFLAELRTEMDKQVTGFDQNALTAISRHSWPGNVRELRNAVERALLTCRSHLISTADLPETVIGRDTQAPNGEHNATVPSIGRLGLDSWLEDTERKLILEALEASGGIQVQAARLLGITERSLWHRLKKLDIRIERNFRY